MFALSPKQDLVLLATKHNNPGLSWSQISRKILSDYGEFIPTELCSERYSCFLKFVEIPQSISALSPYQFEQQPIEPSNFVSSYRELKRLASYDQTPSLSCFPPLVCYQKRMVRDLLFSSRQKDKLIYKMRKSKELNQFQQNELVNNLYNDIRRFCDESERLTRSRVEELVERIVEQIIDGQMRVDAGRKDYDGREMAKLMRCHGLTQERREILDIYYEDKELSGEERVLIGSLLEQINNLYKYQHLHQYIYPQNNEPDGRNSAEESSSRGQEAPQSITNKQDDPSLPNEEIIIPIYLNQKISSPTPQGNEVQHQNMSTHEIKQQPQQSGGGTEQEYGQSIDKTVRLEINTNNIQIAYAPNNAIEVSVKMEAIKTEEVKVQSVKVEEIKEEVKEEETRVRFPRRRKRPINVGKVWIVLAD